MRVTLSTTVLVISMALGASTGNSAISNVLGAAGECDTAAAGCNPIPLSPSILCNGGAGNLNCPQYFSPDFNDPNGLLMYGITNIFAPPRCVKSADRGLTWAACPTNPFSATYFSSNAVMTVAVDGSILAAAKVDNVNNLCVIKRSDDGGSSWATVHTSATRDCVGFSGAVLSSPMACASNSLDCVLFGSGIGAFILQTAVFHSEDGGLTWTEDPLLAPSISSPPYYGARLTSDGSIGVTGGTSATGGATSAFVFKNSGAYHLTTAIPGSGINRCTAPLIVHNNPTVLCGANSVTQQYTVFEITGSIPTIIGSFFPTGAPQSGNSPETIAISWDNNETAYVFMRELSTGDYRIYVTKDAFATVLFLGELIPTNRSPVYSRGDVHIWNGKIYWTSGGMGGDAQLMVIQ